MDKPQRICAVFDYTSFLGASSSKKWTFAEALQSFAPVFGSAWSEVVNDGRTSEERLWETALKRLSSSHSDESNLIELIKLAKYEGINEIKLVMPYALEQKQIDEIQAHSAVQIQLDSQDDLIVTL